MNDEYFHEKEDAVRSIIDASEEMNEADFGLSSADVSDTESGSHSSSLPNFEILNWNLGQSSDDLRDLLATADGLFDRGVPVRMTIDRQSGFPVAHELSTHGVVMAAHNICQPVYRNEKNEMVPKTLPERLASMYLAKRGEWRLRVLNGITTAPVLVEGGAILDQEGYDPKSGLWCVQVPKLKVPDRPSRAEAEASLMFLRRRFSTFPFADSPRVNDPNLGVQVVDLSQPPGADESALLNGLLTAIARASLWHAPGLLVTAPSMSGAGSGKGLLVRALCLIAFGNAPQAFTAGSERHELDKRIAAELVEAAPALFLDNVNGTALRSDLLANAMTERPARVRVLGKTRMVLLNSTAFIAVVGNGLTVSEDLARRFITVEFDAQCENPEARPFPSGFLKNIEECRAELLTHALTIWRWGQQNTASLERGKPFGSFEKWAEWVRDPLHTLGCTDPVSKIADAKSNDPARVTVAEFFTRWNEVHGDSPITATNLDVGVCAIVNPQGQSRQWVAAYLQRIAGTRMAGFVLTAQKGGHWSAKTYQLTRT